MKRHMRRILRPWGKEMKQDTLAAKGDLLKARQTLSRLDVNNAAYEETLIGEAQAAPKKKRRKKKKGGSRPKLSHPPHGLSQSVLRMWKRISSAAAMPGETTECCATCGYCD